MKTLVDDSTYVDEYAADFTKRFSSLLAFDFAKFLPGTALQILDWRESRGVGVKKPLDLKQHFSAYDLERVNLYTKGVVDYHLIIDVLPSMIRLCATGQINVTGLRYIVIRQELFSPSPFVQCSSKNNSGLTRPTTP